MSDARTRQYTGGVVPTNAVALDIGEDVHTSAGQLTVLAAVNALVRHHPRVFVRAPNVTHPTGVSFHDVLTELGTATDTSHLELVDTLPRGVVTIGVGADVRSADLYLGADRFTAIVSGRPVSIRPDPTSAWGGGLAAMRAANIAFRRGIGLAAPQSESLSLWTFADAVGPSGPAELGPIDVGDVWLVGAGGVGSSLAWWLHHFGVLGAWTVIDHGLVELSNLNRSLGLLLRHLGAEALGPDTKAEAAAGLIPGARAFNAQWDDWARTDPSPPDVLIAAANDFGVRGALANYSHPVAMTGATSPNWTADLHLYRAGIDGCIDCRHPAGPPTFGCATGSVPDGDGGSADAALSFLSGTAALLCAAGLARLQVGEVVGALNHWQLTFFEPARYRFTASTQSCVGGAPHCAAPHVREQYFGNTRWANSGERPRRA